MCDAFEAFSELAALGAALHDSVVERESRALSEQVARREINILVVGQFKRGKSSLVNAILQEDLMPTGALPVTGISTAVRYGSPPSITALICGEPHRIEPDALASYVSEIANPRNRLSVSSVDVVRPVESLRGIALYDTPGVGSTFEHNTAAARAMLPRIDAAVLVVGPEPPLGAQELAYAREIASSAVQLFVVFNKDDLAGDAREELVHFTEHALAEIAPTACVFPLSATRAREAQRRGQVDTSFDTFLRTLHSFVEERGGASLLQSIRRRADALIERADILVSMRETLATLPRKARKERRGALDDALRGIDDRVRFLELTIDDDVRRLRMQLEVWLNDRHDRELLAFISEGDLIAHEGSHRRRDLLERLVEERAGRWRADAVALAHDELAACTRKCARVLAEIDEAVMHAGCDTLHVTAKTPEPREIAFAPTRLTVPVSVDPTTSLEVLRDMIVAALPKRVRSAVVRRRIAFLLERELDALRGKLRYGIAHDLEPWRQSLQATIASSLQETRCAVLAAFRESLDDIPDAEELSRGLRDQLTAIQDRVRETIQ